MKKMITILLIIFGGIVAFNAIKSIVISYYFSHYEAPPVYVSAVVAEKKNWEPKLAAVGNFLAINGVEVNSEVSGKIVAIPFDSGQYVEKGMPLIDLDDSVDQATLKFNQADMALKEINYKRQSDLYKRNATSSSSVDEARANYDQAKANVEKITSVIRQKHITAPFSGQLGIRQVNLGQYVTPGTTSVVTLQSLDPLYLEFNLPEQYFKLLHLNQGIEFQVEQYPGLVFKGKITAMNAKVDPNTHNILIHATVPNCSTKYLLNVKPAKEGKTLVHCDSEKNRQDKVSRFIFIPGMFAAIRIEQAPLPNTIVLPSTAISYSLYGNSVFLIKKTGKKDKHKQEIYVVQRVYVTLGDQEGNETVIKTGIQAGDWVVSSGELKLQNGTQVVINNNMPLNKLSRPENLDQ